MSDLFDQTTPKEIPSSKPYSHPPQGQGVILTHENFPSIMADAKGSDKDFEPCPAGSHVATCYQVIDIGTCNIEWQGKKKSLRKVRIVFELPEELMEGNGKPFSLGKRYTLSLNKKATLRAHLEAWRGRPFTDQELLGFNLNQLLGVPCIISVIHEARRDDPTKIFASIQTISGLVKGMKKPELINPLLCYSISQGKNHPTFGKLPEWLQNECSQCLEWKAAPPAMEAGTAGVEGEEEDTGVPF